MKYIYEYMESLLKFPDVPTSQLIANTKVASNMNVNMY